MRLLKFLFTIIIFFYSCNLQAGDEYFSDRLSLQQKNAIEKSKSLINQLMKKYHVPGLSIALVDEQGILWKAGFGFLSQNNKASVTPQTLFAVESNSKMFTTLGVLLAAQNKRLNIDQSISFYLPNIHIYSYYEKNPVTRITLKRLLSHTAGFTHEAPLGNNYDSASVSFDSHMQSIMNESWLIEKVGQYYHYSNIGMDLAGYILQTQFQMPFPKYMYTYVLQPLHMNSSTFDPEIAINNPNTALGTSDDLKKMPINYSMLPSAGLFSNAEDISQYIQFQLNEGKLDNHIILENKFFTLMHQIPFPVMDQTEGYTLGLWKFKKNYLTGYGHLGRGFGFSSSIFWYPSKKIGAVVLTNQYGHDVDSTVLNFLLDKIMNPPKDEKKHPKFTHRQINLKFSAPLGKYYSDYGMITLSKNKNKFFLSGSIGTGPFANNQKKDRYLLQWVDTKQFYLINDDDYYKYVRKTGCTESYLLRIRDGMTWFYNDSFSEPCSINKKIGQKYVGIYYIDAYGILLKQTVHLKNGHLYFNDIRIEEMDKGIFRLPNGELLNLNPDHLNWKNIKLKQVLN